jgi:hypothetical protein
MEKLEVFEPLAVKKQIIKSATEAASMILELALLNSRHAFPNSLAISGSFVGPKTNKSMAKIRTTSCHPKPNILSLGRICLLPLLKSCC